MATKQQNNEEEVDLGSLFVIIGKGFSNLFNFIGNLFKSIFHFFITILLFLKEHLVKIAIAAVLGFIVGFFIEMKTPKRYTSDLLLQPNFKSSRQLYNNIHFYSDLVKQKDTLGIQKIFGLTKEEASSLKKFTIEPIINQKDIVSSYDDLVSEVDTLALRDFDFEEFQTSFTTFDYKLHRITVVAEKKDVFQKLDEVIIAAINNPYFSNLKKLTNENLNRTDSIYRQNLSQVDSLRSVYMQALLAEAKKESSGTNIDFGSKERPTKEIELFNTHRRINFELKEISETKSKEYEIINVIYNFQPIGEEIKGIIENNAFQFAVLFALATILLLLLLKLNSYLNSYKK